MTVQEPDKNSTLNWHDSSSYVQAAWMPREAWAMVFLRRDTKFAAAAASLPHVVSHLSERTSTISVISVPVHNILWPWGLYFRWWIRPPRRS